MEHVILFIYEACNYALNVMDERNLNYAQVYYITQTTPITTARLAPRYNFGYLLLQHNMLLDGYSLMPNI